MNINFKKALKNQRGDTIIEILISMAILAIVLGTAFVSSTHSLQTGVDAGNRNRALNYAQEQVEFMKSVAYKNLADATKYRIPNTFCVSTEDGLTPILQGAANYHDLCETYRKAQNNGQYALKVNYNSTSQVSTITVNWASSSGSGQDQLKMYYRLPR